MNRTNTPAIKLLNQIPLNEADSIELVPGVKAYLVKGGKKEVVKIQTYFNAGRWQEPQKLVAQLTATMLKEGTKNLSAKALAEKIDYYGATLSARAHFDYASITVSTMRKFLPQVMDIKREIIAASIFPEKELNIILSNLKQKLAVLKEKPSYLASTQFYKSIFGAAHPYGYDVDVEDYNQLSVEKLFQFYQDQYQSSYPTVYISGKFGEAEIQKIRECYTGLFTIKSQPNKIVQPNEAPYQASTKVLYKKDALQAAIRIGKPIVGKHHPDRFTLNFLNVLLGGYFGSRLMSNIREDKGYTYAINSSISSYMHNSYFLISTEVGIDVCDAALNEIFNEIDRLKNEPVKQKELQLVKNYISGALLRLIDGPFKTDNILKGLYDFGLDTRYFQAYVDKVKHITAEEIQQCAQQYLNKETLTQVIARK